MLDHISVIYLKTEWRFLGCWLLKVFSRAQILDLPWRTLYGRLNRFNDGFGVGKTYWVIFF